VKTHFQTATLMSLLMMLASCAGTGPEPVEIPGYGMLQEPIKGTDVSALGGRRIVLDPGHGGYFRGAIGQAGLTEAEVNLGVALHLRGLLEWAGAEVWMTRTSDSDFLTAADSTLAGDLAFRVAFTDSLQPDVLLSLHHNSVASLDRTVNETQTYYPLGDGGASLDLARAIHRHLVLNLEITPASILPGNFHVLRHATVPAVLGEPAMISNPVIEGRLSLAASQRLEAEAYFLGLLDYFAQGNPVWSGASLDTLAAPAPGEAATLTWTYQSDGEGREEGSGPGLDPATIRVTRDGRPAPFSLETDGRTVIWTSAGSPATSPDIVEIAARNLAGRATPRRRTLVPPALAGVLAVTVYLDEEGQDPVALAWRTSDGRPAPRGHLRWDSVITPDTGGRTRGWMGVPTGILADRESSPVFEPEETDGPKPTVVLQRRTLPAPWRWRLLAGPDGAAGPLPAPAVTRTGNGLHGGPLAQPDPDAPLAAWYSDGPVWIEIPGYLPLVSPAPADSAAAGTVTARDRVWPLTPLFPDLLGRTVVLDPAGGGSDPDGTGPLGLRGADLNLEVARLLADLLRGAGVRTHLTRQSGTIPLPEDKVALAGSVDADFFLTIGRTNGAHNPTFSHHHGSVVGTRWAALAAKAFAPLLAEGDTTAVNPAWDYLLRHTACPALDVRLPGPGDAATELILTGRDRQRAEAAALFLAFTALTAPPEEPPRLFDPAIFLEGYGGQFGFEDPDLVVLDGQFVWTPPTPREAQAGVPDRPAPSDSLYSWEHPGLPLRSGTHTIEVRRGGRWMLFRYETTPTPTLEALMSGP
jgi:N-acetylmuramoyl-L-alanine amidase